MINQQNDKFVSQQTMFNNKLTDMMSEQSIKLTEIRNLTKTVTDQQLKINKLEKQNDSISKGITELVEQNGNISADIDTSKCNINEEIDYLSPEIIISGIPTQLNVEPQMVIDNILHKLDAPQLISDVLETRLISNERSMASTTSND